ncbi:MAG: transcriptional regulator [Muribaculaceae bacterium]
MYNDLRNIHIGELIRQRLVHLSMSYAEFARRLHIERTTVYSIVRSKSIDIERLIRISQILDYDFISLVYQDSTQSQCHITIPVKAVQELLAGRPITVTAEQ